MADLRYEAAAAAFDAAEALLGRDAGEKDAATVEEWLEMTVDGRAALYIMRNEAELGLATLDAARPVLEARGSPARRGCPRDDIVTKLISAEIDGNHLSDDEFGFFVLMLAVAGNETTRNAIAHGMLAFLDHPDQWELFKASRPDTAADEVVRWATPITVFQRTATQDAVLGGHEIKAGQRVGLFYRSANFDEEVFEHPERFDVLRSPNPHLGYGGLGTHYCLGASLAKLEIELIFNAIADAMPDIAKAGDAVRLRSGWINGIKHLPVTYRP